ncbi:MAG: hypothetical protein ABFD83_01400 [Armatimonadota bacterium]
MRLNNAILNNEKIVRTICLIIAAICLLALTALLLMKKIFAGVSSDIDPAAWRILLFAVASIAYMVMGLVMVVWHLQYLTLSIATLCLIVSAVKSCKREWHWSTSVIVAAVFIGHATFLLYL